MRYARRLRFAVLFLIVGILMFGASVAYAASYDVDLGDVLDGNVPGLAVQISGTGGYHGKCMGGAFTNDTGQVIRVYIPVGMKLVPPDASVQVMVTAGAEILEIPPGNSDNSFTAFCSEQHDGPPTGHSDFSNGGLVDRDLMAVLERISDAGAEDSSAQAAVWNVTDDADISANEDAQQYLPAPEVPPGRAAGAGLAAGLTGLALAEALRRMSEAGSIPPSAEGPPSAPKDTPPVPKDTGSPTDDGSPPKDDDESSTKPLAESDSKPAKKPAEDDKPKAKTPPKPPKPLQASEDGGFKWDRKRKRVTFKDGPSQTHIEAGRGGGWIGIGGGPDTNPFELKPPGHIDINEGDVSSHKRGGTYDATIKTGDGGPPVHIYRNDAKDQTRLQRGHFILDQQGNRTSAQGLINGKTTGASYDGSKNDFDLFRSNFRLSRQDGTISVSEKMPGGRKIGASYNSGTGDFSAQSGSRIAARADDTYGYHWGDRSAIYDSKHEFGAYSFPTNNGKGNLSIGGGSEGQFGIARTQPLRIGGREARLNIDYSRMLRDSGAGLDTEFTTGLDVGRVSVNWKPGDHPSVRYNVKF